MTDTTNTIGSKLAALALTVVASATLLLSAVGPATALGNLPHHSARVIA